MNNKRNHVNRVISENTPIREGKNLLLRMCTLHPVMKRKPML